MHINLAMFKYHSLIHGEHSPIKKLKVFRVNSSEASDEFEVHLWLKDHLRSEDTEASGFYGSCDSTGTDSFLHIATWKACSELLERWAFHQLLRCESDRFGMETDQTTTGFAALSCWPKKEVRKFSYAEALERWAISNWWTENITASFYGERTKSEWPKLVKLNIPNSYGYVVIAVSKILISDRDVFCYGFAHGHTLRMAERKAFVEMNRNKRVLGKLSSAVAIGISDHRLKYFSTAEGFNHFSSKVMRDALKTSNVPELIVDSPIPGEWDKYGTVWRCLLPNTRYNWSDKTHFMF